jgi:hypothetical protein
MATPMVDMMLMVVRAALHHRLVLAWMTALSVKLGSHLPRHLCKTRSVHAHLQQPVFCRQTEGLPLI